MPNCKTCQKPFEIEADREFYNLFKAPDPSMCPECRSQRRVAHTNHRHLYRAKCDATGVPIISMFHPSTNLKVYGLEHWFSDAFDPLEYGQEYDFNRPFFEQFKELADKVPRYALLRAYQFDENSDYTNYAGKNKNCYMIFDSDNNWDCYYSEGVNNSKSCMDGYKIEKSELCYECVDVLDCYQLYYFQDCNNCAESAFLKNCIGCKRCFMCTNLKNKEYYIYNKKSTKEEFERLMRRLGIYSETEKLKPHWDEFKVKFPQKFMHGFQNENVSGDYLSNCKDSEFCFDSANLWSCKYVTRAVGGVKTCFHSDEVVDDVELLYECVCVVYNSHNCKYTMLSNTDVHDLEYSTYCHYSSHCFGCVGLKRHKYCILNKQYTEEEYKQMLPKIVEHMKSTGEYGEFFPMSISDFAYNKSVAQDYFPLTKEEALAKGLKWQDPDQSDYLAAQAEMPDNIADADDTIVEKILVCDKCTRNYKIIDQEYRFHKGQNLALPRVCFYCRWQERFDKRNKRVLYERQCAKTGEPVLTTYVPDSPWIVYSEQAYQDSLE